MASTTTSCWPSGVDRVGQVLARIAGITDGVFVTDCPTPTRAWRSSARPFEHHEVLGPAGSSGGHVVAAAHSAEALASALRAGDASEVAQ